MAWPRARAAGIGLLGLIAGAGLPGCASMSERMTESMAEAPAIGLPAGAPARPATPPVYPAVHDIPPPRQASTLNALELQQLEDELVSVRDRQQASVGPARPAPARATPARTTPARATTVRRSVPRPPGAPAATPAAASATSSQSIY